MHFVKKKVAGKTYLSIAETHRVNGVPKTSIVKYVGSAEKLFKILMVMILVQATIPLLME